MVNFVGFSDRIDAKLGEYYSHPNMEKTTVVFNYNLSKITVDKIDELISKLKRYRR